MSDHFGTLCIKGLTSIEDICPCSLEKPTVSCAILDGPVILNMLSPVNYSTFRDYAPKVFLPFICYQVEPCNRIDIAGDVYKENTLKESARREKMGSRTRGRILPDSKIPGNWYSFLQTDESKDDLLEFLAVKTSHIKSNQVIASTYEDMVVSNYSVNVSILVTCTQEEDDTESSCTF